MIPEVPQTYIDRPAAAAYLTARGLKTTVQALADLKYRSKGPRCAVVNGRALYTRPWLETWLEEQVERSLAPAPHSASSSRSTAG